MSAELPPTPVRITSTATSKLPRTGLLLVGVLYILSGLFFRDPWKTDDVVGLATMLSALSQHDIIAWLIPHIGSLAHLEDGPFVVWAGSISIQLFSPMLGWLMSPLDAMIVASRLPNLLWFSILASSVWYGTYLLGRRPEPQPLALPFGGEPSEKSYGRMVADAALLLTVATVGIIWRLHETSSVPAVMAFQALAFYAIARMLDRVVSGALTLGIALGALFLIKGWLIMAPTLFAALCIVGFNKQLRARAGWLLLGIALATILGLIWWLMAKEYTPYWIQQWHQHQRQQLTGVSLKNILGLGRDLPWFLWPTWPFVLLGIWRWRHMIRAPHIWVPLMLLLWSLLLNLIIRNPFEPEYALLAIPSAILAAFALPTLKRGVVNSLDWFAVMCFSLAGLTVWLGWIAQQTGWPPKISHNIARQTTGFDIVLSWPAVSMAVLGSVCWIALVSWRLLARPLALWRGTVLSAGGLIVTWLLLVTLWMPALDYARSYRTVATELASVLQNHMAADDCLRTLGVGTGQRASFYVFENIDFSYNMKCAFVLQQTTQETIQAGNVYTPTDSEVVWQGKRPADRHEVFRLIQLPPS